MATVNLTYRGLTGLLRTISIDNAQTLTQLRDAIATDETLTNTYYKVFKRDESLLYNSVDNPTATLADAGITEGDIIECVGVRLANKEQYQNRMLEIAAVKRAAFGDTSANYYRATNVLDKTELPTQFSGNNLVDNPNVGGLEQGRPWD